MRYRPEAPVFTPAGAAQPPGNDQINPAPIAQTAQQVNEPTGVLTYQEILETYTCECYSCPTPKQRAANHAGQERPQGDSRVLPRVRDSEMARWLRRRFERR